MQKKIRIKKSKILVYYFLVIVLPSIILGALAFRGVINDQAINEKESRQQLVEAGENIISESDLFLSEIEEEFLQKTRLIHSPIVKTVFFEDSILSGFLSKNSAIESIFYFHNSGEVKILKSGLLYFPDGTFKKLNSGTQTNFNNSIVKGWQYEFREKNYQKAIHYYQNIIRSSNNESFNASLLILVARNQKKLLNHTGAINTYKRIEKQFSHKRMSQGIPLGAIALMETSKLYLTIGDTLNALKTTNHLISLTKESHWELEVSQYKQLISATNEIIELCNETNDKLYVEQKNQINSTLNILDVLDDNTDKILIFQNKVFPIIKESGYKSPNAFSEFRVYTDIEQKATYFSLFPQKEDGQWGIIFNLTGFLDQLTQTIIPGEKQKLDFKYQIVKNGRELLAKSTGELPDDIRITSVFPSYMPSWSLIIYKETMSMMNSFINGSQGVFIYIFLFIVIVLILGLFFTLQIINKELLLSKIKSDFISTVSHEFKSPLTSIRQMSEMLFNERIKTESRKKEYYAIMLEQSERLSHLIDNILDFSKIEEGKKAFRFEKISITELIVHVKSVFQNSITNEGFTVLLSIPEFLPELIIDKEAIQQVLYNLLDNAYKYSNNSKKIEINVESSIDSVKISIKDYGIGIQQKDQQKIFERFFRGGNELTRSVKGSGIGLTIVKKIVDAHHGTVSFESTPGKGSTFQVTLPVDKKTES